MASFEHLVEVSWINADANVSVFLLCRNHLWKSTPQARTQMRSLRFWPSFMARGNFRVNPQWFPRDFIQLEVSINAISKNMICCKTGLNVGDKTRNITFQPVWQHSVPIRNSRIAWFCDCTRIFNVKVSAGIETGRYCRYVTATYELVRNLTSPKMRGTNKFWWEHKKAA